MRPPEPLPPPSVQATDIVYSLAAGLRDSVRPAILLTSVVIFAAAFLLCTLLFLVFADAIQGFCLTATREALGFVVDLAAPAYSAALRGDNGWLPLLPRILSWLLFAILYLLSVLSTFRLAMEWLLMGRVRTLIKVRYPQMEERSAGLASRLRLLFGPLFTFVGLAPLFLLLPLLGGPLLFLLGGYLLVRTLINDALEDIAAADELRLLIRHSRGGMLVLGSLLALLAAIPPLGLLAPGWIASSVCHFAFRRLIALRAHQPREARP